jgi:hypothetical protein
MNFPEYVSIDGTNYATEKFSEAARIQVINVQVAEAEIIRLQQQLAIAQTARSAYVSALVEAIKTKEETPAEAPKKSRVSSKKAADNA